MKRPWLITVLAVIALILLAYGNGLGGEFVLDDRPFLLNNAALEAPHSLAYFFTENVWYYSNISDAYSASYRPLFFLSFWLSNQLSLTGPLTLHLFSLLLHILATVLLLFTIRRLLPGISPLATALAVAIFAVHPVHAEAVAWVSAFTHPLVTVFLLAACLAHDRSRNGGGTTAGIFAPAFFGLALLSGEMAVTFPFFILLHDRVRYGCWYWLSNLPYLVLLALYMLVRKMVLGQPVPLSFSDPDMWLRLPVFALEYLRQLLLPWPQPLYLQMPDQWGASTAAMIIATLCIAGGFALFRIPSKKRAVALLAVIWIAVFLIPPMAASFSSDARFALRSLYLPSVGLALLLAWLIDALTLLKRPFGVALLASLVLLSLGGTIAGNRHWANDGEVYSQVVHWNPNHHAGYLGLGQFHERQGEVEQAIAQYEQAALLAASEEITDPLEHLASLLGETGQTARSLEMFRQLTVIDPKSTTAWTGVGNNMWALGQLEAAADAYMHAHTAEPDDWTACYNLVLVLNQLGLPTEAARYNECAKERR